MSVQGTRARVVSRYARVCVRRRACVCGVSDGVSALSVCVCIGVCVSVCVCVSSLGRLVAQGGHHSTSHTVGESENEAAGSAKT